MAQTILNGGNKTTQDQYVGPENELSVDTSNRTLRLHDGAQPGGHEFLPRDSNDERYQRKNDEFDGLANFEPQERGILARLGPGSYRLRSFQFNEANLVIENPDGYDDNPAFSLAPTIESPHTWNGEQDYNGDVTFHAGLSGNLTGDSAGHHTGDVTGNVTGDLTGDATGNHQGSFTGDADFRGSTVLFDDAQIPLTVLDGLLAWAKQNAFTTGMIMLWSGAANAIPTGWHLCNGLNSTPDLRNRFIVGADIDDVGDTGGAVDHVHEQTISDGGHDHEISVNQHSLTILELPAHSHKIFQDTSTSYNTIQTYPNAAPARGATGGSSGSSYDMGSDGVTPPSVGKVESVGSGNGHTHDLTIAGTGAHTHDFTTERVSNLPPFYALCYIMKG